MADKRVTINPSFEMTRHTRKRAVSFQVIGERSSGTNYVHKLLRNSLTLDRETYLGWKHGFPHVAHIRNDFLAICVVRNAVDWLLSMHRKPWHTSAQMQRMEFSEFIRAPWNTEVGAAGYFNPEKLKRLAGLPLQFDRHPVTGERFTNIVALRNYKLAALLGMPNRAAQCVVVQFEHVLEDPSRFVRAIKDHFDITGPDDYVVGSQKLGRLFHGSTKRRPASPEVLGATDYEFLRSELDLQQEEAVGFRYRNA